MHIRWTHERTNEVDEQGNQTAYHDYWYGTVIDNDGTPRPPDEAYIVTHDKHDDVWTMRLASATDGAELSSMDAAFALCEAHLLALHRNF